MRKSFLFIFVVVSLISVGCFQTTESSSTREYILNIENTSGLKIDSIIVIREIGGTVDTLRFLSDQYIEIDTNSIQVSFPISSEINEDIGITFTGYSYDIAVIEKQNTFVTLDADRVESGGVNQKAIDLLQEFKQRINGSDTLSEREVKRVFDSLFVEYTLNADSSDSKKLYEIYIQKPNADTAYFLTQLINTLQARGDVSAQRTLAATFGISEILITGYATVYADSVTIGSVLISSSSVINSVESLSAQPTNISSEQLLVSSQQMSELLSSIDATLSSADTIVNAVSSSASLTLSSTKVTTSSSVTVSSQTSSAKSPSSNTQSTSSVTQNSSSSTLSSETVVSSSSIALPLVPASFTFNGASINQTLAVSIKDAMEITYHPGTILTNGIIVSQEWKYNGGSYAPESGGSLKLTAPNTAQDHFWIVGKSTDSEGTVIVDSIDVFIDLDAPVVAFDSDNSSITKADDLLFNWMGSDQYGSIIDYSIKKSTDFSWVSLGVASNHTVSNPGNKGTNIYYLRAIDDDGVISYDTTTIQIVNAVPVGASQQFSISENSTGSLGGLIVTDDDGDALSYSIKSGNSAVFSLGSSSGVLSVIQSLDHESSQTHFLTIEVGDGDDVIEIDVTVTVLPVNDNSPVFTDGASVTHSLTEDTNDSFTLLATDLDGDALKWRFISTPGNATVAIGQTTGVINYTLDPNVEGRSSMVVEVSDATFTDQISVTVLIAAVDDESVYVGTPTVSGTLTEGSNLSIASGGTCTDVDYGSTSNNVPFTYQWYRDVNNSGLDGAAISGATGTTYRLTQADGAHYIYARVTCSDGRNIIKSAYTTNAITFLNVKEVDGLFDSRGSSFYDIVYIGTQVWMAQNLNYAAPSSYCKNGDTQNCIDYGRLYSWAVAMDIDSALYTEDKWTGSQFNHKGVCPTGWHLPSSAEWDILEGATGNDATAGQSLKATTSWNSGGGTDLLKFTALAGGHSSGNTGVFSTFQSTQSNHMTYAYGRSIENNRDDLLPVGMLKTTALSVRCIKNSP